MRRLLTIDEAAEQLGVPKQSLQSSAQRHGFLIRFGRALRLDPGDLPSLIAACKEKPVSAATGTYRAPDPAGTNSESVQRALDAAKRLKDLGKAKRLERRRNRE